MPEVEGQQYPYNEEGMMQAKMDQHQRNTEPKYGSADFSVQPDKLNYDRYGSCRPNNQTVGYDGNLTARGKAQYRSQINPDPTKSSRPIPNGMFPKSSGGSTKRPTGGGY